MVLTPYKSYKTLLRPLALERAHGREAFTCVMFLTETRECFRTVLKMFWKLYCCTCREPVGDFSSIWFLHEQSDNVYESWFINSAWFNLSLIGLVPRGEIIPQDPDGTYTISEPRLCNTHTLTVGADLQTLRHTKSQTRPLQWSDCVRCMRVSCPCSVFAKQMPLFFFPSTLWKAATGLRHITSHHVTPRAGIPPFLSQADPISYGSESINNAALRL